MNEPIISPWLIYFINLANPIKILAVLTTAASIIVGIQAFLNSKDAYDKKYAPEKIAMANSVFKTCKIVIAISLVVAIFVPCKSTIYKMIAASYVTPANVQAAGKLTDEAVDKVIEKIIDAIKKFEDHEQTKHYSHL